MEILDPILLFAVLVSVCDEVYSAAKSVTQFLLPSKKEVALFSVPPFSISFAYF